jgi:hypothetical protein
VKDTRDNSPRFETWRRTELFSDREVPCVLRKGAIQTNASMSALPCYRQLRIHMYEKATSGQLESRSDWATSCQSSFQRFSCPARGLANISPPSGQDSLRSGQWKFAPGEDCWSGCVFHGHARRRTFTSCQEVTRTFAGFDSVEDEHSRRGILIKSGVSKGRRGLLARDWKSGLWCGRSRRRCGRPNKREMRQNYGKWA